MKKYLLLLAAISLLLVSCATKADIESLQQQINNLTNTQIATINMQIANIQKSIGDLSEVDRELNGLITGLREDLEGLDGEVDAKYQELNLALGALENEDALLDQRIKDLKTYCDQQDNGVKSWATTTFATLEQHGAVLTEIAGIKTRLGQLTQMISDLDTSLSQKISDAEGRLNAAIVSSESSVKAWVNEKLADYYTIAQIEAKLKILEDGYKEGDEALSTEISTLRGSLETAKTELTTAYQTAIATAIEQNNGVINAKIAADIKTASDALQDQIDEVKGRLDSIESRLSLLEASVAELIGMVQSIVVVPDYSDGSVRISNTTGNTIRFEVYPLPAAAAIAEKGSSILSLDFVETTTKASSIFTNIPIAAVSYTDELLVLSVDGSGLPESVLSGSVSANARLKISDGNITKSSEYFPLTITSSGFNEDPIPADVVDLGLSVYWATCNIGASKPEEYGDYYAWGETETKSNYCWESYKFRSSGDSYYNVKLSKYNTSSSFGIIDNKIVLEPEDDIAHIKLGNSGRLPTYDEWKELMTECTWTWTKNYNGLGVKGMVITAGNGNSIFLPAAGLLNETYLESAGSEGDYWSSSLFSSSPYQAWGARFYIEDFNSFRYGRCLGYSIRPVYGERPSIQVESMTLDKTFFFLLIGEEYTLSVSSILPENANDKRYSWSSSDSAIASVDNTGKVTAKAKGKATIKATANDGSGVSASCSVEVYRIDVPQAVDMGTVVDGKNIKWASFNIGASRPEEYGLYYAWGETEPKDNYSWSTYKWGTSSTSLTKYNTDSSHGIVDNKTILEPEDDVAHVKLGGKWRMPTDEEWTELRTKCTWTWKTNYNGTGINGRLVTAPNGNSIFLPAAGYRYGTYLGYAGSYGYYWSSSLYTDYPNFAWNVLFNSVNVNRNSNNRYYGQSVRPVTE